MLQSLLQIVDGPSILEAIQPELVLDPICRSQTLEYTDPSSFIMRCFFLTKMLWVISPLFPIQCTVVNLKTESYSWVRVFFFEENIFVVSLIFLKKFEFVRLTAAYSRYNHICKDILGFLNGNWSKWKKLSTRSHFL